MRRRSLFDSAFLRGSRFLRDSAFGSISTCAALTLAACGSGCDGSLNDTSDAAQDRTQDADDPTPDAQDPLQDAGVTSDGSSGANVLSDLVESSSVYADEVPGSIRMDLDLADLTGFQAVNDDVPGASVAVIFREGLLGVSDTAPNARLELRGRSTRFTAQKSYKIKLDAAVGLWRGQRIINLNKHPYDLTRTRNKLSFDLFRSISHLTSLRTQFVRLFINGEDYGLYTQVEQPNRLFLTTHGLDPAGRLYKAEFFEFTPISGEVAGSTVALASIVEAKGVSDHTDFLAMVGDVNNYDLDIDDVIRARFNRNNYVTWLAVNLLLGNIDTASQNFYLYSPSGSRGFYFLPWDYDGAWGYYEQPNSGFDRLRWQRGFSNWWVATLHRRFFERAANIASVTARAAELHASVIREAETRRRLAEYHDTVLSAVAEEPDLWQMPTTTSATTRDAVLREFEVEYSRIPSVPTTYLADATEALAWPMPFFLGDPLLDDMLHLYWDAAMDLQGDAVRYDVEVARSPIFSPGEIISTQSGLSEPAWTIPVPPPGIYFFRVIARDTSAPATHWQTSFDAYWDELTDRVHGGLRRFEVP